MSEPLLPSSGEEALARETTGQQISGGVMLRQAREAQGLHIAALAVSLKVPVKKIEALEADRFDLLPDTVFVRALTSSICRALKIDPEPVLKKMPLTSRPQLRAYESGINIPFRSSTGISGMLSWDHLSKPLVGVVLGLLLGALILAFLPVMQRTEVGAAPAADTAAATAPPAASLPLPEAGTPPVAAQPGDGAGALSAMVPGSGATTGVIVFKARALSWVEVVDASGVVQIRKNLAEGEVVGVSGVAPLQVVVGRADTTEVQVHGKPFDLAAVARENIARFEVN